MAISRCERGAQRWVQVGVRPREGMWSPVYAALAEMASELIAEPQVTNFFFMHKAPGLRVRFEAAAGHRDWLEGAVYERLDAWRDLIGPVSHAFYEPEEHLFGGPDSMHYVHRLFTVDALAWLAFHRHASPRIAWVYSLSLLRHLLDGLAVVGWEDLDVWERIRRQGGRHLPQDIAAKSLVVSHEIRTLWSDRSLPRRGVPEQVSVLIDVWGKELHAVGREWHAGYFSERGAAIGSREAAAFATIFHWNRGRLPAGIQALVTAALCDRAERP